MSRNLSYSKGPDAPLLDLTLSQAVSQAAARFPDREALISRHQDLRLTWREFDAQVTTVARGLAGLGLQPLDRVGIWSTNCVEWILLQYACARAGFVLVSVNPAYRSHELGYVIRKSRIRAIFLWEKDARSHYQQILEDAGEPVEHVIHLGAASWTAMLKTGADLPQRPVMPDDPTNIQYTSGTTGNPKGVVLTHRNLLNNAYYTGLWLGLTEQDRMTVPVPLYHCSGSVCSVLNCITHAATIILPCASFDPLAVLAANAEERATATGGVPTMFIAQLQHPDFDRFDLTSLRAAFMGGSPCPVALLQQAIEKMHCRNTIVVYGQTEASPVITMNPPADSFEQRTGTIGAAGPNTEVKIIEPATGRTLPLGEIGELCARGYLIMSGYDGEPEATARAIDSDGWLHTGDLASMRDDGHFNIRGRARDLIIRGGENIYPAEVEAFLFTHPQIADAQVVGLPDLKMGEVVCAWIRLKPGETGATAADIQHYFRNRIAHFKIPQHIRIVDSFPMTVTGKIQKYKIREAEIEALGLADQDVATA